MDGVLKRLGSECFCSLNLWFQSLHLCHSLIKVPDFFGHKALSNSTSWSWCDNDDRDLGVSTFPLLWATLIHDQVGPSLPRPI